MSTPRVVLVDDHQLFRAGVRAELEGLVEVVGDAATVGDAIDELERRWPGMRDRLCSSDGAIRRHINVFVDGRRAALDTPLAPGTDVFIVTAVSGALLLPAGRAAAATAPSPRQATVPGTGRPSRPGLLGNRPGVIGDENPSSVLLPPGGQDP
jgi:molybdopterin converting factor small subunit